MANGIGQLEHIPYVSSFSRDRRNTYVIKPTSMPDRVWGLRLYGDTTPSSAWDNNGWAGVSELQVNGSAAFARPINFATNLARGGLPVCTSNAWQSGSGAEIKDGNFENDAKVWLAAQGDRFVGVAWTSAQERVAGLGVTLTFYSDGGWFLDNATNPLLVEYSVDGTNWLTATGLQKGRYTADCPAAAALTYDYRGSWLFTFDTLSSIQGLRLNGRAAGGVVALGTNGYVSIREFQVFPSAATWSNSLVVASEYGSAAPLPGTNLYPFATYVSCSVGSPIEVGTTQYVCTGWAGEGSVPASGASTSVSFTVTNDSTLVWLWRTNFWLEALAEPHGLVDPTNRWIEGGSNIIITAQGAEYYHFTNWTSDVTADQYENPLKLLMDASKSVTAHFAADLAAQGTPHWWLAQYGLTNGGWTFEQAETNHSDTDTFDNKQEYIAATDPTNPASYFHVVAVSNLPPLRVYFLASSNRQYTMNWCSNLVDGVWTNVPGQGPRGGAGGADWMQDTNVLPTGFYRLDVRVP